MNQRGNEPMTVCRSLRMSAELYEWLEKVAREDKRKVSDIIRLALEHCKDTNWRPFDWRQ